MYEHDDPQVKDTLKMFEEQPKAAPAADAIVPDIHPQAKDYMTKVHESDELKAVQNELGPHAVVSHENINPAELNSDLKITNHTPVSQEQTPHDGLAHNVMLWFEDTLNDVFGSSNKKTYRRPVENFQKYLDERNNLRRRIEIVPTATERRVA